MTIRLTDLGACFEGVIPSIISTASADGMPNISYLSHVVMVDEHHVALSNQFFAKTAANIRANPHVTLLIVDAATGTQYLLRISFSRSVEKGPLFERIALELKAGSAQVGLADVMRLRSADVFQVLDIRRIPSANDAPEPPARVPTGVAAVLRILTEMDRQADVGGLIDAVLEGISRELGFSHAVVLFNDPASEVLVTVGALGYPNAGIGSEVLNDDGLIGSAATSGLPIKVSDMSRVRRFGKAVADQSSPEDERTSHSIAVPQLGEAMSQLAVPIKAGGSRMHGVIFVESTERMAFRDESVNALELVARHLAMVLELAESDAEEPVPPGQPVKRAAPDARTIDITHHAYDDSVFIGNDYVIKGVAGRLLVHLLDVYLKEGRAVFTNREIRHAETLRLPDFKDNLETRLLLLRRRLESKGAPVRILSAGRGKFTLEVDGAPVVRHLS
jgi:adenylate cyclase